MNAAAWTFPFIAVAGILQAAGAAMNGALNKSLVNPWLATSASFLLVLFVAIALFVCMSKPLPTVGDMAGIPWWAPLGAITGAVACCALSFCRDRSYNRRADVACDGFRAA